MDFVVYEDLYQVPPHVAFSCLIDGNEEVLRLSYDDPDRYNFLDDPAGNSYIEKEYLIECGPFTVLDF